MSKTKNVVIDQQNKQKQENDFIKAVLEMQEHVSLETLDRLHTACHDAIAELQGDMRLTEAAGRYAILSHILTVEMVAFKAYARKYTETNNKKQ